MAQVAESTASLRIMGDDLEPTEVSGMLGCTPTQGERKGDRVVGPKTGHVRIAKSGMWRLEAARHTPENLDAQIEEILSKVSSDPGVWMQLRERYTLEIFSGLFMNAEIEGLTISAKTVRALGDRGIELGLDIYAPTKE